MFNIQVCDLQTAVRKAISPHTKTENPTHIVSLLDDVNAIPCVGPHHLVVEVSDISVMPDSGMIFGKMTPPVMPAMNHLEEVLNHTKNLTDDDYVIVHCFAGQSRSTAMAIAICIQHGMHWKDAFEHIYEVRPVMIPNQKMIALIDEKFDLKGEFVAWYREWLIETLNHKSLTNTVRQTKEQEASKVRLASQMQQWKNSLDD
jgi:predicted protein tyrosine phosphatase